MLTEERQTGAEEQIEVTEEMIEAGVEELVSFNRLFDDEKDVVRSIFLSMIKHLPKTT